MTPRLALHISLLAWLLMAVASGQWGPCPGGVCPPQYAPQYAPQPQYRPQPQSIEWSDNPSDVVIKCPSGNDTYVGSGTVVHTDGQSSYVLTNYHVIRDGQSVYVCTRAGNYQAQVVDYDQENDLALLRVNVGLVAVEVGEATPQTITIRSYDGGRLFKRRTANVKGSTGDGALFVGAVIAGGSSGGGCYDSQGRLVGVVWGCRPQDRETYLTPIGPIRRLLVRIGLIGAAPVQPQQPAPLPQQPPQREQVQLPPCKCDEQWDAMAAKWKAQSEVNKQLSASITNIDAKLALMGATPPAQCEITEAQIELIANKVIAKIDLPTQPQPTTAKHYVLVADEGADYWHRLSDELRRAQQGYSKIKQAPVPDFPVGPLPQLVEYQAGKPLRTIAGQRKVSDALHRLAQGTTP